MTAPNLTQVAEVLWWADVHAFTHRILGDILVLVFTADKFVPARDRVATTLRAHGYEVDQSADARAIHVRRPGATRPPSAPWMRGP